MQIAIIGLGLIGGSLAKALKENTEHTVIGFDRDENTLLDALSLGAIDSVGSTSLLENADVVYVCLYPADVVRFVEENAPHFKEGCIVTDVCGIKNQVCGKLTEIAKNYPFVYVGGHPMAGKERSGFDASEASLFYNASYILVPGEAPQSATDTLVSLAKSMGFGTIKYCTQQKHDRMIAYTSQIPHVLACAYVMSPRCDEHSGFSAGSYKDMTRVAWLAPHMWAELFMENKEFLLKEIDCYIEHLSEYKTAMEHDDEETLIRLLDEGKKRKEEVDG
mgnify:FL=1